MSETRWGINTYFTPGANPNAPLKRNEFYGVMDLIMKQVEEEAGPTGTFDTINPETAGAGVTVDGILLKSSGAGGKTIEGLTIPAITDTLATLSGTETLSEKTISMSGGLTMNGNNIVTDATTGTKIGGASNSKLSFWDAVPVIQQAHIADPVGGATVDAEARTAINSILAQFATIGLHAAV